MKVEFTTVLQRDEDVLVDVEITFLREEYSLFAQEFVVKHEGKLVELTDSEKSDLETRAIEIANEELERSWIVEQGRVE